MSMNEDRSVLIVSIVILLTGVLLGSALLYTRWQREKQADTAQTSPIAAEASPSPLTKAEAQTKVSLALEKLQPLAQGHLEIWADTGQNKASGGKFKVSEQGQLINLEGIPLEKNSLSFPLASQQIQKILISLEPENDTDNLPSGIFLLAGNWVEGRARLVFEAVNLNQGEGNFVLATPTNGPNTNETSGVWFIKLSENGQAESTGLTLPDAPQGFKYEGWILYQDNPVTTGRFSRANAPDEFSGYSGQQEAPPFPGEDFLQAAPEGFNFPLDLTDGKASVAVTLEPDLAGADPTGDAPFQLKFLTEEISQFATDHQNYELRPNLDDLPSGTVEKRP